MKKWKTFILLCFITVFFTCSSNNESKSDGTVFDPTGYYLLDDSLRIGDYAFDNLSILTNVQDNNEKSVVIDKVFIQLLKPGTDSVKRLEFKDYIVHRDKLELIMTDSELGKISLIGKFNSINGPINDSTDNKTNVLQAKLKVNNDFEKDLKFNWFIGD
jgi:hypothetical protein